MNHLLELQPPLIVEFSLRNYQSFLMLPHTNSQTKMVSFKMIEREKLDTSLSIFVFFFPKYKPPKKRRRDNFLFEWRDYGVLVKIRE